MHTRYYKEYSHNLGRDMEFKVYGHAGLPMVVFPCQDGKFFDFESRGMIDTVANHLEEGRLQLFCIGCVDEETWSAKNGDHHGRIMWHEQWVKYICEEFLPRLHQIHAETDSVDYTGKVMLTGASMGGYHCVNFYLRFPHLFGGCLSLSGLFHAEYFFQNYSDMQIYYNSPTDFMRNMPADHPYIRMYNERQIIIVVGQGAWEGPLVESTRRLDTVFAQKGIHARMEYWGYDVHHDWPWWFRMVEHYVPQLLG